MICWRETAIIVRVYFVLTQIALLIQILGFSTPLWFYLTGDHNVQFDVHIFSEFGSTKFKVDLSYFGLWQICGSSHGCFSIVGSLPAWFGATRAFETMGLIGSFVISVEVTLFMFIKKFNDMGRMPCVMMITSLVTGVFILIGVIIWGAEVKYFLNFSFYMCCISGILYIPIAFIMCMTHQGCCGLTSRPSRSSRSSHSSSSQNRTKTYEPANPEYI